MGSISNEKNVGGKNGDSTFVKNERIETCRSMPVRIREKKCSLVVQRIKNIFLKKLCDNIF
jgi:hypothetical protein